MYGITIDVIQDDLPLAKESQLESVALLEIPLETAF
jgi:hypothetical protein